MQTWGGHLFEGRELIEGTVQIDASGQLTAVDRGAPDGPVDEPGIVLPAPVNAHTHIADRIARGQVEATSIEEVVAPPDGLKHRILRAASPEDLVAGMGQALSEAHAAGTVRLLDFREGGPAGARMAHRAAEGCPVELTVLGRPTRPEAWEQEAGALVNLVDGLGISGLEDQPAAVTEDQAAWCHAHGKRVALHLSEGRREDVDAALALQPDLLVHLTQATPEDIQAIAEAEVPVALCPRSNALFGQEPPVPELVEAGLRVGLGTDNAMFQAPDTLMEAAYTARTWPELAPETILEMATGFHLDGEPVPRIEPGAPVVLLDASDGLRKAVCNPRTLVPWRKESARRRLRGT